MPLAFRKYSSLDHDTWRSLFERQAEKRDRQIHPLISRGIERLGLTPERVPDLEEVNRRLEPLTGFRGVPVEGLEKDAHFFEMLSERRFPIGNFIRDPSDLSYTPAPDVFHDLYGHLPFLADIRYADFCAGLGRRALKHRAVPDAERQFSRLFWFAIEFGLIRTEVGMRIFGAGIASSIAECGYALGGEPLLRPFDLDAIRKQDFRIDDFQRLLFVLESEEELYGCLDEFERIVTG